MKSLDDLIRFLLEEIALCSCHGQSRHLAPFVVPLSSCDAALISIRLFQ